jgi:hypothetical protein
LHLLLSLNHQELLVRKVLLLFALNRKHYSFHWSYNDEPHRFKCYLERKPIEGTTSIYNFEIYDSGAVGGDSLIYATSVGTYTHLKDRISFYTWMTNQIVLHM